MKVLLPEDRNSEFKVEPNVLLLLVALLPIGQDSSGTRRELVSHFLAVGSGCIHMFH
jgi:hypothetical protein